MNASIIAHLLTGRLSEIERMKIRAATTEDAIVGLYHDFRAELPGGNRYEGSENEGIATMKEVVALVNAEFVEASKADGFPGGPS